MQPNNLHSDGALLLYRLHAKAKEEAAEARRKLPDALRGINEYDWDNMDWANGIKPGEAVTVMGESGMNRVWNAPDFGFRPVMTNRPKGVYSKVPYGGKGGDQVGEDEKKEDGSNKKGKNKKKGWRYGKMSLNFYVENFDVERNETELEDMGEDFGVGRTDRNETIMWPMLQSNPCRRVGWSLGGPMKI